MIKGKSNHDIDCNFKIMMKIYEFEVKVKGKLIFIYNFHENSFIHNTFVI